MTKHPFDVDDRGNIIVHPLTGYTTSPIGNGMAIIVRLEFADDEAHMSKIKADTAPPSATQLIITPGQALELSDRLRLLAHKILEQSVPPKSSQS